MDARLIGIRFKTQKLDVGVQGHSPSTTSRPYNKTVSKTGVDNELKRSGAFKATRIHSTIMSVAKANQRNEIGHTA